MLEMEVGGWLGPYQIRKVNKSPATGRVVSIQTLAPTRSYRGSKEESELTLHTINVERLAESTYRAPTDEDKQALAATIKAEKQAKPKSTAPALVNPTDADAERLQAIINERCVAKKQSWEKFEPVKVCRLTQTQYSAASSGSYAKAETRGLCADATLEDKSSNLWSSSAAASAKARGPAVCKIRVTGYDPVRVIVITDKPQKSLPAATWGVFIPDAETQSV